MECTIDSNGWNGAPAIVGGDDCDNNDATINPGEIDVWYDGIDANCSGGSDYDLDGDGADSSDYSGTDCDDTDATVYLGATDTWYDGIDSNCDGADDFDQDGDGFISDQYSGGDCDDTSALINPNSLDDQGDGIDDNCDGYADEALLDTANDLQTGAILVTEVMQNPAAVNDVDGEWFEIYNTTTSDINLVGLEISDLGSDSFLVGQTLIVEAESYVVLGNSDDIATNGGITLDYDYGSQMTLGNSDDEILLSNDLGIIDMVAWDNGQTFPDPSGASMNLDPTSYNEVDNDDGSNWCESTSALSSGDYGTPGLVNDSCSGNSVTYTYTGDVLPILTSAGCTGCHSGPFASLTTLLSTQAGDYYGSSAPANMPWVTAADTANSYMYLKIQGTAAYGVQMPRNGTPLSSTDQQIIEQWILQGAQ